VHFTETVPINYS